jgi:hypothetical protein
MRAVNNRQLKRYLMREIHGVETPRKPPRKATHAIGKPVRDRKYRAWIRTLPCAHCGTTYQIEAAHTGSDGGMRQKSSDTSCIPLCHDCHQAAPVSYHRNREALGLDFPVLVSRLQDVYAGMAEYFRGQE